MEERDKTEDFEIKRVVKEMLDSINIDEFEYAHILERTKGTDEFKKKVMDEFEHSLDLELLGGTKRDRTRILKELEYHKTTGNPYRDELIVSTLISNLSIYFSYQKKAKTLTEKKRFQQDIDFEFKLLYKELKKPFYTNPTSNLTSVKDTKELYLDNLDRFWSKKNAKMFFDRYPSMLKYTSNREKREKKFIWNVIYAILPIVLIIFGVIITLFCINII